MSNYQFTNIEPNTKYSETLLLNFLSSQIPDEILLDDPRPDTLVYFHGGDKMTINTHDMTIEWEPLRPGEMFNSTLALRFHQWFDKGLIRPMTVPV